MPINICYMSTYFRFSSKYHSKEESTAWNVSTAWKIPLIRNVLAWYQFEVKQSYRISVIPFFRKLHLSDVLLHHFAPKTANVQGHLYCTYLRVWNKTETIDAKL